MMMMGIDKEQQQHYNDDQIQGLEKGNPPDAVVDRSSRLNLGRNKYQSSSSLNFISYHELCVPLIICLIK